MDGQKKWAELMTHHMLANKWRGHFDICIMNVALQGVLQQVVVFSFANYAQRAP